MQSCFTHRSGPSRRRYFLGLVTLALSQVNGQNAVAPASPAANREELSLAAYMQRVVEHNESVQARLLAFQASRSQRRAENGTFEPAFVTSGEYVDRKRPNTVELERSLRSGGLFKERNENYSSSLEMQTALGTRLRLGATGRQLINNIQRTVFIDLDAEYETSVGLVLEQPLLKGAGPNAMLASLRIAARGSEIAFQEYRRSLMTVVAESELAYWQLYYAQQEVRLAAESVGLAQTLVRDSTAGMDAGRGSKLDVLEAEAGLAMRRSRESLSRQRLLEAQNRVTAYFGGAVRGNGGEVLAAEAPELRKVELLALEGSQTAQAMNPDLLRAQAQVGQEMVRAGYAKNQRLPQLDLKSSFAATGLGFDWTSSWRDVEKRNFPAWTVGLEFRIPITGGMRGRNEYRAAQLRLLQAQRIASDVTTQVRSGLDSAMKRVEATHTAAQSYQAVVEFRTNLLQTRLQGKEVGRLDSRSVLEAEQELFAARLEQLQSAIEYQRALLELQIISGSLLQGRGLEIGFAELEERTNSWIKDPKAKLPTLQYQPANFARWPMAPAEPFLGESDPSYPGRLRLTRPLPWQKK
jgi:outer membrane protein TolC